MCDSFPTCHEHVKKCEKRKETLLLWERRKNMQKMQNMQNMQKQNIIVNLNMQKGSL